jgi:spore germination protein GerM
MNKEAEEKIIHDILEELLKAPSYSGNLLTMHAIKLSDKAYANQIVNRLVSYALVTSAFNKKLEIKLTPHGIDIARYHGGYLGYRTNEATEQSRQKQAQLEKDELERDTAAAAVSSASSSASSAMASWAAVIVSVISLCLSIYAVRQSNELDEVKKQLKELQQQTTPALK